ncbi:MAG TPA: DUF1552 domain-containing protein [Polyangiaceae bacterium]|nr:DUF1552 domain-containing protein [Polyangiaceae bacterium]
MTRIHRRTVLRGSLSGSLVTLALPLLECMGEGRGEAFAQSLNPRVFGVFFWGGGLPHTALNDSLSKDLDVYTPPGAAGVTPLRMSPLLAPLASSRDYLNVITGLNTSRHQVRDHVTHYSGQTIALTGDGCSGIDRSDLLYTYSRPSIDRVVAKDPGFYTTPPRLDSVQLCAATSFFKSHSGWNCVTMDGPNQPLKPILDPKALYGRLFGGYDPSPAGDKTRSHLRSALSAVMSDAKALKSRIGVADQARLEKHLDGLRSIELELEAEPLACTPPDEAVVGTGKTLLQAFDLQARILVAALRCDITRVFSFMVTGGAHSYRMDGKGVQDGAGSTGNHGALHAGKHDEAAGNALLTFTALQNLLARLAAEASPSGGTLLDSVLIYATSEYGTGWHHKHEEFPVILAGKAGGRLKTGNHVRVPNGNISDVGHTIVQALDLTQTNWGWSGGESTSTLPVLV